MSTITESPGRIPLPAQFAGERSARRSWPLAVIAASSGDWRFDEGVEWRDLPRLLGSVRGVQPACGVRSSEVDESVDEVSVEEEVAEQLAVCGTVTPEETVQEREVGGAKTLAAAVAGAEDL